jgi:hypothetical protein
MAGVILDHVDYVTPCGGIYLSSDLYFRFENTDGFGNVTSFVNAFRIFSPDGAKWHLTCTDVGNISTLYNAHFEVKRYGADSLGSDTVEITGVSNNGGGMPEGYGQIVLRISLSMEYNPELIGKTICIDYQCIPSHGCWSWSYGSQYIAPSWDGLHSFQIVIPNMSPRFTNCPSQTISVKYPEAFTYDLDAIDPEGDPITEYSIESCPEDGSCAISKSSGLLLYSPGLSDIGQYRSIGVSVTDSIHAFPCWDNHRELCFLSVKFTADYGDANGDSKINVGDAIYLINYIFKDGPKPDPLIVVEVNCDGTVNVGDIVFLVNYIFKSGPVPRFECL